MSELGKNLTFSSHPRSKQRNKEVRGKGFFSAFNTSQILVDDNFCIYKKT